MRRLACDAVVHERAHIVLKTLSELINCRLVAAFLDLALQKVVVFDDGLVAVGEVILGSHRRAHSHRGSNRRRGHSQPSYNQVLRPLNAQDGTVFLRHFDKNLECIFSLQALLLVRSDLICHQIVMLHKDGETSLRDLRLLEAAAILRLITCLV